MFVVVFFHRNCFPELEKRFQIKTRGCQVTLRQSFLGPDGWPQFEAVDLKSHCQALGSLKVLLKALPGALGRHVYADCGKFGLIFESFLGLGFQIRQAVGWPHPMPQVQKIARMSRWARLFSRV